MYLPQLFERKAFASPDALAIACESRRINYGELNHLADLIAKGLREAGVAAGCLVGVLLDRSPEMVAGLLGIWKAGGAYVPLDPAASCRADFLYARGCSSSLCTHPQKVFCPCSRPALAQPAPIGPAVIDLDDFCARRITKDSFPVSLADSYGFPR